MIKVKKVPYTEVEKFRGYRVGVQQKKRKERVYFYSYIDKTVDIGDLLDDNVLVYECIGDLTIEQERELEKVQGVYIIKKHKVDELSNSIVEKIIANTEKGVTPVIELPKDFKDYEMLCRLNDAYQGVRYQGGYLFDDGICRIGVFGSDIIKKGKKGKKSFSNHIKDGVYDNVEYLEEYQELCIM